MGRLLLAEPGAGVNPGNVDAAQRLLRAVADLLGGDQAQQPDPRAPRPDFHGVPRVPGAKAYIAQATSKDIARGRVRA